MTDILDSFTEISARLKKQRFLVRKIENIMKHQDFTLLNMLQIKLRIERLKEERRKLNLIQEELYVLLETIILPDWVYEI